MRCNHWIMLGIASAVIAALAALWFAVIAPAHKEARIATGYVAKTLCSCVFVDARSIDVCRGDLDDQFSRVHASINEQSKIVRTRTGRLVRDVAIFDKLYGCRLK